MNIPLYLIFYHLLVVHGPSGNEIYINPDQVVTIRPVPQADKDYVTEGIKCVVQTTDGKNINVIETCDALHLQIEEIRKRQRGAP